MSIQIKRYNPKHFDAWNDFVARAKNATFLFNRDYVGYHEHRFPDHSLLIYHNGVLSALFIANEAGDTIESHGGLTYGGLIIEKEARLERVLQFFYHVVGYYSDQFEKIRYKCVPSYFQTFPANEDLYALFMLGAKLYRRDTNSVLDLTTSISIQRRTSQSYKIFESKEYNIVESTNPDQFWEEILVPNLKDRHGVGPVHTAEEIKLLMDRFPDRIKLFEAYDSGEIVAGALMYITSTTAHLQYISSNEKGRAIDASGVFIHYLTNVFASKHWFSFGISNTNNGTQLNLGLLNWKEGFGARTFVHDFYEIETASFMLLRDYE